MITPPLDAESLRPLFTKPYGVSGPTSEQGRAVYAENVHFIDPSQEKQDVEYYIRAQDGLIRRCDDLFPETRCISLTADLASAQWRMGLKIKGLELTYSGTTQLVSGEDGRIIQHRDYFDFVGPTFGSVPILGSIVRWIYKRFIS